MEAELNDLIITAGQIPIDLLGTPGKKLREQLSKFPNSFRYSKQTNAIFELLEACSPWLPKELKAELCLKVINHESSIYQAVSRYSPTLLADHVRFTTCYDNITDIQAIAAFTVANLALAIDALSKCLQGVENDEVSALELYQLHLDSIAECVTGAGVWLSENECQVCIELGELSDKASIQAKYKIWGCLGEESRKRQFGEDERNKFIRQKALELIGNGTKLHNLNTKLRDWQERETGQALSKVAMALVLKKLGFFS